MVAYGLTTDPADLFARFSLNLFHGETFQQSSKDKKLTIVEIVKTRNVLLTCPKIFVVASSLTQPRASSSSGIARRAVSCPGNTEMRG